MTHIIINSIGTANPSASKILAESFNMSQEYFLKQLYSPPSLLFNNVEENLAEQTLNVLSQLGLDIKTQDNIEDINFNAEQGEISVSIENIRDLPKAINEISEFLGSSHEETFTLLSKEPAIIIGNVTQPTADALQKRTSATICFSNPKKDRYAIVAHSDLSLDARREIEKTVQSEFSSIHNTNVIQNVEYRIAERIWTKYKNDAKLQVINQSHQSHSIELMKFDIANTEHIDMLTNNFQMPEEIIPIIHDDLPILLYENMQSKNANRMLSECSEIGIKLNSTPIFPEQYSIEIEQIEDTDRVNQILSVFYDEKELATGTTWKSPQPISRVVKRYLKSLLETSQCEVKKIQL